jgi:hypothetical protein
MKGPLQFAGPLALEYAKRGWPVLPLWWPEDGRCACPEALACSSPAKHPLTRHGLKEASCEPGVIAGWFDRWPNANVGIATSAHLHVLDVDDPQALGDIEAAGDLGGLGPMVATSRGLHIYMQAVPGIGNRTRLLGAPIDWRGENGYVVAPPSVHISGHRYSWCDGYGPDRPLSIPPLWLTETLRSRPQSTQPKQSDRRPAPNGDRYAEAALTNELGRLALAADGTRNDQLNRSAHALGSLVAAGRLDAVGVAEALLTVAARIGLDSREAEGTIASGMRSGARSPRRAS